MGITTWEVYNGYIKEQRQAGATLQEIADEVGRSRERIRQILKQHYGSTRSVFDVGLITTKELAEITGYANILDFKDRGIIEPSGVGEEGIYLWRPDCVTQIQTARGRCKICTKPIPKWRKIYCSDTCRIEGGKYKYKSEVQKQAQIERALRWAREHPDQVRVIRRRATKNYQIRHHKKQRSEGEH